MKFTYHSITHYLISIFVAIVSSSKITLQLVARYMLFKTTVKHNMNTNTYLEAGDHTEMTE